jgi:hypothetical protein
MAEPKNKRGAATAPFERASERNAVGLKIDVKAPALRDLMTEQSRVGKGDIGWATYYVGSGAELAAAGNHARFFWTGALRCLVESSAETGRSLQLPHRFGCVPC